MFTSQHLKIVKRHEVFLSFIFDGDVTSCGVKGPDLLNHSPVLGIFIGSSFP